MTSQKFNPYAGNGGAVQTERESCGKGCWSPYIKFSPSFSVARFVRRQHLKNKSSVSKPFMTSQKFNPNAGNKSVVQTPAAEKVIGLLVSSLARVSVQINAFLV